MTDPSVDPVDAIATALARLGGRRQPYPRHRPGRGDDDQGGRDIHGPTGSREEHGPLGSRETRRPAKAGDARGPRFGGAARVRLLEALAAAPAPATVSALADAIGVDQPRASRLVQQAVEEGHARREADPDDARRALIALTGEGHALVWACRRERREAVETAVHNFSPEERAQLAALITRLADAWPHP